MFSSKRVYRFVLKRLFGQYLLNKHLSVDNFDLSLRNGVLELRDLHFDPEIGNAALASSSSASSSSALVKFDSISVERIKFTVVSYRDVMNQGCILEIEGVRFVMSATRDDRERHRSASSLRRRRRRNNEYPHAKGSSSSSSPLTTSSTSPISNAKNARGSSTDANEGDDTHHHDDFFEDDEEEDLKKGLDFIGEWIERISAKVKTECRDLTLRYTLGGEEGDYLLLRVDRAAYAVDESLPNRRNVTFGGITVSYHRTTISIPLRQSEELEPRDEKRDDDGSRSSLGDDDDDDEEEEEEESEKDGGGERFVLFRVNPIADVRCELVTFEKRPHAPPRPHDVPLLDVKLALHSIQGQITPTLLARLVREARSVFLSSDEGGEGGDALTPPSRAGRTVSGSSSYMTGSATSLLSRPPGMDDSTMTMSPEELRRFRLMLPWYDAGPEEESAEAFDDETEKEEETSTRATGRKIAELRNDPFPESWKSLYRVEIEVGLAQFAVTIPRGEEDAECACEWLNEVGLASKPLDMELSSPSLMGSALLVRMGGIIASGEVKSNKAGGGRLAGQADVTLRRCRGFLVDDGGVDDLFFFAPLDSSTSPDGEVEHSAGDGGDDLTMETCARSLISGTTTQRGAEEGESDNHSKDDADGNHGEVYDVTVKSPGGLVLRLDPTRLGTILEECFSRMQDSNTPSSTPPSSSSPSRVSITLPRVRLVVPIPQRDDVVVSGTEDDDEEEEEEDPDTGIVVDLLDVVLTAPGDFYSLRSSTGALSLIPASRCLPLLERRSSTARETDDDAQERSALSYFLRTVKQNEMVFLQLDSDVLTREPLSLRLYLTGNTTSSSRMNDDESPHAFALPHALRQSSLISTASSSQEGEETGADVRARKPRRVMFEDESPPPSHRSSQRALGEETDGINATRNGAHERDTDDRFEDEDFVKRLFMRAVSNAGPTLALTVPQIRADLSASAYHRATKALYLLSCGPATSVTAPASSPPPSSSSSSFTLRIRRGKLAVTSPTFHHLGALELELLDFRLGGIGVEEAGAQITDLTLSQLLPRARRVPLVYSTKWCDGKGPKVLSLAYSQRPPTPGGTDAVWEQTVGLVLRGLTLRADDARTLFSGSWLGAAGGAFSPHLPSFANDPFLYFTRLKVSIFEAAFDCAPILSVMRGEESGTVEENSGGAPPPKARALVSVARARLRSNVVFDSPLQSYEFSVRDCACYVAQEDGRPRDDQEHLVGARGGGGRPTSLVEFAEQNGYVRVGAFGEASAEVRVARAWADVEISFSQELAFFTCADSAVAAAGLASALAASVPRNTPPVKSDEKKKTSSAPTVDDDDDDDDDDGETEVSAPPVPPRDDESSAAELRRRYAEAPDDQLSAAQLRVRYNHEPHLSPFVIDDFYAVGSLPSRNTARDVEVEEGTAGYFRSEEGEMFPPSSIVPSSPEMRKHNRQEEEDDEWVVFEGSKSESFPTTAEKTLAAAKRSLEKVRGLVTSTLKPGPKRAFGAVRENDEEEEQNYELGGHEMIPPPRRAGAKSRGGENKKPSTASKRVPPSTSRITTSLSHFDAIIEEEEIGRDLRNDSPRNDENGPSTSPPRTTTEEKTKSTISEAMHPSDPAEIALDPDEAALLSRSVLFVRGVSDEGSEGDSEGSVHTAMGDDGGDAEENDVQLIEPAVMESESARGNAVAKGLSESYHRLTDDLARTVVEAEDEAAADANEFHSALYESRVLFESSKPEALLRFPSPPIAPAFPKHRQSSSSDSSSLLSTETGTGTTSAPGSPRAALPLASESEGRWLEDVERLRIFNNHLMPPPPGAAHVPSAGANAARMMLGRAPNSTAVPTAESAPFSLRVSLKRADLVWRLFAGHDFVVPVVAAGRGRRSRGSNKGVHSRGAKKGGSTKERVGGMGSGRGSDALEVRLEGATGVIDLFPDGSWESALAVAEAEVRDHVARSAVRKLMCYWVSETQHPRETGAPMLRAAMAVAPNGRAEVKLAALPLRLCLDQDALELARSCLPEPGVEGEVTGTTTTTTTTTTARMAKAEREERARARAAGDNAVSLEIKAFRVKVDYIPKRVDYAALREGRLVELLNLFAVEGLEVALRRVVVRRADFAEEAGEVMEAITSSWTSDIVDKGLYRALLASVASPLPLNAAAALGRGMADVVLLPYEIDAGRIARSDLPPEERGDAALRAAKTAGRRVAKFSKTLVMESLGVGARLSDNVVALFGEQEPRMKRTPRGVVEGMEEAVDSVSKGLKAAHHVVVAVPLSHAARNDTAGAIKSCVRAVPVAVLAPMLGLVEGFGDLSRGVRHALDKDTFLQTRGMMKRNLKDELNESDRDGGDEEEEDR